MKVREMLRDVNLKLVLSIFAMLCVVMVTVSYVTSCGSTENLEAGAILDNAKLVVSDIEG